MPYQRISPDHGGWYPWGSARNEPEIDVNNDPGPTYETWSQKNKYKKYQILPLEWSFENATI